MTRVKNRYIPINKGHFNLETEERTLEFNRRMASGWETEYAEYRRLWSELPKKREVREYPLLVDLELSSVCNLKCPMCNLTQKDRLKKVETGFMDMDLYAKVIREISGKVYAVRLSYRGESTLHKEFIDAIRFAKKHAVKEVSFLTNGSTLSLDFFEQIVEAGADWITISIDGLDEEYNAIRKPLFFAETFSKIKAIHAFKVQNKLLKPVIKIQGVWPAIRPNPEKYYNTLSPFVDLVAYNPLIDYLHKDLDIVYEEDFSCPQMYQRLVVGYDGQVMACANDAECEVPVGNANSQTIHELWHGERMRNLREVHSLNDGYRNFKPCQVCYYPRKAVPDEKAIVNGRTVVIENYINRKQSVGE